MVDSLRGIFRGQWGIEGGGDGYPWIGLVIGDTPSAGHDSVMLDYRDAGPDGPPRVVHAIRGDGPDDVTLLAGSFEDFSNALAAEPPRGATSIRFSVRPRRRVLERHGGWGLVGGAASS